MIQGSMTKDQTSTSLRICGILRRSFIGHWSLVTGHCFLLGFSTLVSGQNAPPISADRAAKDGSVWGALVFASNKPAEAKPADAKTAEVKAEEAKAAAKTDTTVAEVCPNLSKRLGKVFPYSHFEILGQHTQVVFREYESWVVPSRDVFLKLDSKGAAPNGGLNLHVQFWQGQQVLVKTDTLLQPNSPLFISGPKWRDGQLIFVLLLQKVEGTKGT
jgi:hypothetical protein